MDAVFIVFMAIGTICIIRSTIVFERHLKESRQRIEKLLKDD